MPSMNDDLAKYKVFEITKSGVLYPSGIKKTTDYNHYCFQAHHFVRQTIRKTSPQDYERFEKYQKIIVMPKQMNYDLETMGADTFYKTYNIHKWDLVFDRKKWREGYYDDTN